MLLINVLIYAHATLACNMDSFIGKKMTTFIETPEVDYAHHYNLMPFGKRFCHEKRSEVSVFHFVDEPTRRACQDLVEGIEILQHGTSQYHFMSGPTDTERRHDKVFDFTCRGRIASPLTTYQDKNVPPEIKELDSTPSVTYSRHVVTKASFTDGNTFTEDIASHNPKKMHIADLSALDLKFNEKFHSAAYMAVNVKIFHTKLRANIEPTMEILQDFHALPVFSPSTVKTYLEFGLRYGYFIHYASYFGGKLLVLVYHNKETDSESNNHSIDPLALNGLINEALSMKRGKETKVSVYTTGGIPEKQEVESWISSVARHPIPLTYHYMPIHLFLTKGNRTSASEGMEFMQKFEENVNFLKRVSFEISSFPPVNILGKYIQDLLSLELDQACPSEQIVDSVKAGISEVGNVYLTKYYIGCLFYDERPGTSIVQRRILYLIPGVCVTSQSQIPICNQMYYNTPENRVCFVFYESDDCDTNKPYHLIKSFDAAYEKYKKMKSMRLCYVDE